MGYFSSASLAKAPLCQGTAFDIDTRPSSDRSYGSIQRQSDLVKDHSHGVSSAAADSKVTIPI